MCVCDLCETIGMSQSAISHQLGALRRARLVKCRRSGKNAFYGLDDEHVKELMKLGLVHIREERGLEGPAE
jgi:ArsR family transcriptional regulator